MTLSYLAYHWTTRENARKILKEGLPKGSPLTQDPINSKGEVLIGIWANSVQNTTSEIILPDRLFVLTNSVE